MLLARLRALERDPVVSDVPCILRVSIPRARLARVLEYLGAPALERRVPA